MKAKVFSLLVLVVLLASLTGCYSNTFQYTNRNGAQEIETTRHFVVAGLFPLDKGPVVAHRMCPTGVQGVETVHTFVNLLLSAVTFNIYTPNTVRVTCSSGTAYNFYLDENEHVVAYDLVGQEAAQSMAPTLRSELR